MMTCTQAVFTLGDSGGSDIAREKDRMVGDPHDGVRILVRNYMAEGPLSVDYQGRNYTIPLPPPSWPG